MKEKEHSSKVTMVPLDVVPLTTIPTTAVATSTMPSTKSTQAVDQLTKVVQNLSIHNEEIKKLRGQVKALQDQKMRSEASHLVEAHKSHRLIEGLQNLERESSIGKPLAQAKEGI